MKRPDEMKMMTNTKKKQTRNVVMTIFGISVSSYFTFVLVFRILPILSTFDQTLHENLLMMLQNNNASTPHSNQTALSTIPIAANANDKTSSLISTVLVDDDLASSILKGEKTLPVLSSTERQDDGNDDNKKTPKQRTVVKFTPGSLGMKSSETLQFCYTDPTIYQHHFRPTGFGHSISHKYQMIYPFVPKSGSSTARAMMTTRFNAGENWSKEMYDNFGNMSSTNYTVFTFVRDPLSRFFSSYDEAISRQVPWGGGGKKNNNIRIRYPYLYEGMASWADYTNTYCPKHLRLNNEINYCDKNPTMENGTLAQRLTKYVHETGNMNPFDLHLHLRKLFFRLVLIFVIFCSFFVSLRGRQRLGQFKTKFILTRVTSPPVLFSQRCHYCRIH